MKYVLINSWCRRGSTGKIVFNLYTYLKKMKHEVYFFHGKADEQDDNHIVRFTSERGLLLHGALSRLTGLQGFFSSIETKNLISKLEKIKPDFVYLFNLHGYYLNEFMLLNYLKKSGIKVIYMLFDEYPYLGKCCFSEECTKFHTQCENCSKVHDYPKSLFFDSSKLIFKKKKQVYKGWNNLIFAGVRYIEERAKESALARNFKFYTFNMGVDIKGIYHPTEYSQVVKKYDVKLRNKIILTVGFSSDKRKGINKFIEIASMCPKDILFINIGYDQDIVEILPENFMPIKYVGDQIEMAQFYSMADLYVTTSSGEAMSNACLEALGCGTPIAGFDVSGMSYLAPSPIGRYAKYDNLQELADIVMSTPKKNEKIIEQCRNFAEQNYDQDLFMNNLYKVSEVWGEELI